MKIVKRGRMQKAVMGTLAVMMLVSLVLAVFAFVMPTPVAAIPCPGVVKHWLCYDCECPSGSGYFCDDNDCFRWDYYDNDCYMYQQEYHCE